MVNDYGQLVIARQGQDVDKDSDAIIGVRLGWAECPIPLGRC
jgi:hypothetical protein